MCQRSAENRPGGSEWANDVTFVAFAHNSAIDADDVARVITSRTMTASGATSSSGGVPAKGGCPPDPAILGADPG
jgi:hypothetical protein